MLSIHLPFISVAIRLIVSWREVATHVISRGLGTRDVEGAIFISRRMPVERLVVPLLVAKHWYTRYLVAKAFVCGYLASKYFISRCVVIWNLYTESLVSRRVDSRHTA